MRKYPAMAAAVFAGVFAIGTVGVAYSAKDNTAKPITKPVTKPVTKPTTFDHKSLGKDSKDCVKCHKTPEMKKK